MRALTTISTWLLTTAACNAKITKRYLLQYIETRLHLVKISSRHRCQLNVVPRHATTSLNESDCMRLLFLCQMREDVLTYMAIAGFPLARSSTAPPRKSPRKSRPPPPPPHGGKKPVFFRNLAQNDRFFKTRDLFFFFFFFYIFFFILT